MDGLKGAGSITFVRFGRGEEGSDGGSWVNGAGVEVSELDIVGRRGLCLMGSWWCLKAVRGVWR